MGKDFSLTDKHPSVIINGRKYHYGRSTEFDEYLVESASYAKDYWCFKRPEDLQAFLINLPKSADHMSRISAAYPDWHSVTHEQRGAYLEDDKARQRTLAAEKISAGTAQSFNMDLDGEHGPYEPQRIGGKGTANENPFGGDYWQARLAIRDHPSSVRVDGVQYILKAEHDHFSGFKGHGGADFFIHFEDGRLVHTTNLWRNGPIPAEYRDHLPDNARFLKREQFQERTAGNLDQFAALLADHRNRVHHYEEPDGSLRGWHELSPTGKLGYIASDAVQVDVPFERFAQAAREVLGDVSPLQREEAALRLALNSQQELHGLASVLPPDESIFGTPLVERLREFIDNLQAAARPPAMHGPIPGGDGTSVSAANDLFTAVLADPAQPESHRSSSAERANDHGQAPPTQGGDAHSQRDENNGHSR